MEKKYIEELQKKNYLNLLLGMELMESDVHGFDKLATICSPASRIDD